MRKPKHNNSAGKSILLWLIIIAAVGILVFCGIKVGRQLWDYHVSDDTYNKIRDSAVIENDGDLLSDKDIEKPVSEDDPIDTTDLIGIDWDTLYDKGSDIVAWVQLDDISYPVYHDDGSQYYLRHLPDGTWATAGSIFLYGENSGDFTDQSSFIYGHNMANGSMFGSLKKYAYPEYGNKVFYLYLPDGTRHIYQFFSVAVVSATSQAYIWSFADDASFENWQKWMKQEDKASCSAPIDTTKRYVTLSTCNGGGGDNTRLIVCGQEIKVDKVQTEASWYDAYKSNMEANASESVRNGLDLSAALNAVVFGSREALYNARRSND